MPQIISETAVRQTAEDIAQENTVFRDAFRDISVPDRTGDTFDIPVPKDVLGEPTELQPGSDFDYGREEYEAATIKRGYYGSGSRIPMQEMDDAAFSLLEDHVDRHAQVMAQKLDKEAFSVLGDAAPAANTVGSDNGDDFSFDDAIDGLEALESREGGYEGDTLFVGTQAKNGIIRDLNSRGTDLGDSVTETGQVAEYAGVDIMFSNLGLLTNNDAILVDTDFFGYEGEWTGVSTDQEEDFDSRSLKLQIFAELGWVATQPEAAVRVRG